ncbi:HpcH/HpaI aldolase family protein [Sphingomonas flavalba]|uniref:HpcH/HpaI aldolase family protein n=1 Tax=Sphingomonas flavalba TaxID=2559804 RepID=UPI0039E1B4B8
MTASPFPNRTLARLRAGEAARCLWLSLGSPALAEIAAEQAPDAIVLDLQHGLWDVATTHVALATAAAAGVTPLARVADKQAASVGQALDAGAAGVIVPLVDTAEEAAAAVAAAHYPPGGARSGGGMRPLRDFPAYLAASRTETLVAVMIETSAGLDNAAAIARTPGIDMLFVGPGDLGLALAGDGPPLETAIAAILAAAREAGVPCGIFTPGPAAARARLEQGFQFVVADDDIHLARAGFAAALSSTSESLSA